MGYLSLNRWCMFVCGVWVEEVHAFSIHLPHTLSLHSVKISIPSLSLLFSLLLFLLVNMDASTLW